MVLTSSQERPPDTESAGIAAVARVARALVQAGGLHELGGNALGAISEALDLDVVAMYVPDGGDSPILRLFRVWPEDGEASPVASALPLDPEAWRFLASSPGPLVLRQREALVLDNPFCPPADSWLAIPLIARERIEGAVFGSSSKPISLDPVTRSTLGSIADLLSAGAATSRLRLEAQRTELQRERLMLVGELHDGLAQDLALAVREVAFVEGQPLPDVARASVARLGDAVRAAHRLVRAELEDLASNVLEPGVAVAARSIVDRFAERGLNVQLDHDLRGAQPSPSVVAAVARVLNEALTNVERHARTAQAHVSLTIEDARLVLRVVDEGAGVDMERMPTLGDGHFGVAIMRARASSVGGTLKVSSPPGAGMTVELRVPATEVTV